MGKRSRRYVAVAEAGQGWRIWNRKARQWWGERYQRYPEELLAELNGERRPGQLTELIRQTPRKPT